MAELKFLRGLVTNLPASGKSTDNFYITTGATDGDYRLYLGDYLLAQGDVVARLVSLESLMGGEGTGSVADKITNALGTLDLNEVKSEGQAIIAVSQENGKVSATAGDVAASHITVADANNKMEATNVEAALLEIINKIEAEVTNRGNAIAALNSEKTGEGTFVDVTVKQVAGVITEVSVAENDIAKASDLTAEVARADAAEKANKAAIEAEVARADAAEKANKTAIETEVTRAKAAEVALGERIDNVVADAKTYEIKSITSGLGANVKEAYGLYDEDGNIVGSQINIYKDSSLKEVKLSGQTLNFTYILSDGTESTVGVDVSNFLAESEFQDGLQVVDHIVSVKVAEGSESFLTVDENGVKLSGVQTAIDTAKAAATTKVVEGNDTGNNLEIAQSTGADGSVTYTFNLSDVASATGLAKEISDRETAVSGEASARETAISELVNNASDGYKTLKDLEDKVKANATAITTEASNRASAITAAVEALDAEITSVDGSHVAVKVTEVDGKITTVNVTETNIAKADELDALEAIVGEGFTSTKTVAKAISDEVSAREAAINGLVNGATDGYKTLKDLEDKVKANANAIDGETTRATGVEANLQAQIGKGFSSSATVASAIAALENAVGEGGSVSTQISNAIGDLDAQVGSQTVSEGKHIAVEVVETDGKLTSLTVVENDIASASATSASISDEETRAKGVEEGLDTRLTAVETDYVKSVVADEDSMIKVSETSQNVTISLQWGTF